MNGSRSLTALSMFVVMILGIMATGGAVAQDTESKNLQSYRIAEMNAIDAHMQALKDITDGEVPFWHHVADHAVAITGTSRAMLEIFPDKKAEPSAGMAGMNGAGMTGMTGMPGMTGMTGMPGMTGMTGMTGMPGMTGMAGMPGMTGMTGMTGMAGMETVSPFTAAALRFNDQAARLVQISASGNHDAVTAQYEALAEAYEALRKEIAARDKEPAPEAAEEEATPEAADEETTPEEKTTPEATEEKSSDEK